MEVDRLDEVPHVRLWSKRPLLECRVRRTGFSYLGRGAGMDLGSANGAASYNPLTSLIRVPRSGRQSFSGLPFVTDRQTVREGCARPLNSVIHHELVHLGCFQSTRLGWIAGEAGARAWSAWSTGEGPALHTGADTTLGAMAPLLEGLALYAELDLVGTGEEQRLPLPLWRYAETAIIDQDRLTLGAFLDLVRDAAVAEDTVGECGQAHGPCPGLLRRLLIGARGRSTNLYLVGYLWVKAAALALSERSPLLRHPAAMLPFLIRLLCHHPALADVAAGRLDAAGLMERLRETVANLPAATLERVVPIGFAAAERGDFGHWQLHDQLASSTSEPILTTDIRDDPLLSDLLNSPFRDLAERIRAAAASHIWDVRHDVVDAVDIEAIRDGGSIHVSAHDRDTGEPVVHELLHPLRVLDFLALSGDPRYTLPKATREIVEHLTLAAGHVLQVSIGKTVTFAHGYTDHGTEAFWTGIWPHEPVRNAPFVYLPASPSIADATRPDAYPLLPLLMGASLTPADREAFAKALELSDVQRQAVSEATKRAAQHLCPDAARRALLLNHALPGLLRGAAAAELEEFVAVPALRAEPWCMSERLADAVNAWLTIVPFGASRGRPCDLFPRFDPNFQGG